MGQKSEDTQKLPTGWTSLDSMTEEDRNLLLEVKAMLTGGAWGNERSWAPLLGNTKFWPYGELTELKDGPCPMHWIACGGGLYEQNTTVYERVSFDLEEDMIVAYLHPHYNDSKYEIKLDVLIKWAKGYYMKTLEESL